MAQKNNVCAPTEYDIKINKWRVREGFPVSNGQVILLYEICESEDKEIKRLKSSKCGVVKERLYEDGAIVRKGEPILELCECIHATVIKDMCADCGADLRQDENGTTEASVPMVHSVPDLKVTHKLAQQLGQADTERLLADRKLVLLVDLDQTLIHTTNDIVPNNIKGIHHFQLYGPNSPWYHTKLRPGTHDFLNHMAPYYELHICTFGARNYAHMIAQILDPDGKFFSHRILSRDECFNMTCKTDNLKALFPCGDSMVCIIDDREDVWNMVTNLIQVKPYHFFQHTGDINAPPGLSKHELDGKGIDFKDLNTNTTEKSSSSISENESQSTTKKTEETKADDEKNQEKKDYKSENKKDIVEGSSLENNEKSEKLEKKSSTEEEKESKIENDNKDDNTKETIKEEEMVTSDDEKNKTKIESEKKVEEENNLNNETDKKLKVNQLIEIEDPDDYLLHLEEILKKIHKTFYEIYDETKQIPDLKILIPQIRSQALKGLNLVFSGLVPNQMKLEQSRAYLIARSLGANVTQHLTDDTTHLVAVTAGTFKFNAARKRKNIKIVTPDWLWSCAERWEHVDEKLFPLDPNKPSKMRQPPPHCQSPEHAISYNENEPRNLTPVKSEPKFIDTINPLLSFSNADLEEMNQEFDQFFESDSSSEDEHINIENPPVDKILLKRKRDEEDEDRQRKFFSRSENDSFSLDSNDEMENEENEEKENDDDDEEGNRKEGDEDDDDDEVPSVKFRRGEDLPSDVDMDPDSGDSEGSEDPNEDDDSEWNMMGAALEREFLGLEK